MKSILVKDLLSITKGQLIVGKQDTICENFSKDTRKISKGDVYIGIKGEKFDGSCFWEEALKKGASVVIVENISFTQDNKELWKDRTIIKVKNTLQALYEIASYKRSLYNISVIAITGSVGKTSTKDIIASVVSQKYKTLKTEANFNNNIGLPFTILKLKDHQALVLEMGMNHLGEIHLLTSIAKPNICVITNIGTSHIGNLGSRENILKAKLEILDGCKNPTIIINNDNDLLHSWYENEKYNKNIKTFGINEISDYNSNNIKMETQSSKFTCKINNEKVEINVPVGGEHFILNSLCAIAVGNELGIENEKIKKGIGQFELTKKRMDIIELKNGIKIINDSYNASFESMKASIKYLSTFVKNRKIAVLGDMLELGEFAKELHENVGKEIYNNKIDILICSGDSARYIAKQAENEGMSKDTIYFLKDKKQILQKINKLMNPNDVILFKASNGMKFFDIVDELKNKN